MLTRLLSGLMLLSVAATAQPTNPSHDAVAAMGEHERRALFRGGLMDARLACSGISATVFSGSDTAGNAYWDVRCQGGILYRVTLSRDRLTPPVHLPCGSAAMSLSSGPCFRPVETVVEAAIPGGPRRQAAASSSPYAVPFPMDPPPATMEAPPALALASRAGVANLVLPSSPAATPGPVTPRRSTLIGYSTRLDASCRALCDRRHADDVSACTGICLQGGDPDAPPLIRQDMRFGAIYATAPPFGAVGLANGSPDRLAVNITGVRTCQGRAGPIPCLFQRELVNECGAVAQVIQRSPRAVAITADINTFIATILATGVGPTLAEAEEAALTACRAQGNVPGRREAIGSVCRITASGC